MAAGKEEVVVGCTGGEEDGSVAAGSRRPPGLALTVSTAADAADVADAVDGGGAVDEEGRFHGHMPAGRFGTAGLLLGAGDGCAPFLGLLSATNASNPNGLLLGLACGGFVPLPPSASRTAWLATAAEATAIAEGAEEKEDEDEAAAAAAAALLLLLDVGPPGAST